MRKIFVILLKLIQMLQDFLQDFSKTFQLPVNLKFRLSAECLNFREYRAKDDVVMYFLDRVAEILEGKNSFSPENRPHFLTHSHFLSRSVFLDFSGHIAKKKT